MGGEHKVDSDFERPGWRPVHSFQHDFRTDLFLQVRHARFLEAGFIVGAYGAAGASAFDEPFHGADCELFGWWFRDDDREHIDDCLSYGVSRAIPRPSRQALQLTEVVC